jgi:hypothetical protein
MTNARRLALLCIQKSPHLPTHLNPTQGPNYQPLMTNYKRSHLSDALNGKLLQRNEEKFGLVKPFFTFSFIP